MNREIKENIIPLFHMLYKNSVSYINNMIEKMENDEISGDDLMGMVISAHFSSLRAVMMEVAQGSSSCTAKVERFMETIYESMKKSPLIKGIIME